MCVCVLCVCVHVRVRVCGWAPAGGETIRYLEKVTMARIQVESQSVGPERTITITGARSPTQSSMPVLVRALTVAPSRGARV
jgi:hypothetical protein